MIEKITETLKEFNFLSPGDFMHLATAVKLRHVTKGKHIVRVGDSNYEAIKVIKGLLCHYVVDKNGAERILLFVPEGKYSGSLQTTINKKPADENIMALESSILVSFDMRKLEKLASENPRILKLLNQSYKQVILDAAARIKFLMENNPEQRYLNFREAYPNLEQRLRLKDLASFLGVTNSSLSRIRARIVKN